MTDSKDGLRMDGYVMITSGNAIRRIRPKEDGK